MSLFRSPASAIAALSVLALSGSAFAQTAPKPTTAPAPRQPATLGAAPTARAPAAAAAATAGDYDIRGFRSAVFGMPQSSVRSAIAADFGVATAGKITEATNPAEGTTALQTTVDRLEPGPGPAQVTYIFGAASKTLIQVNVIWTLAGEPNAAQRDTVFSAGLQLANYFQTLPTPPKALGGVSPTGPNGLLMYAATDKKGAAIQVTADGISYQATGTTDNKRIDSPPPTGPSILRVAYILNSANPDIFRIKPGAF